MSETVHAIRAGSLVRCLETDRIGCVIRIHLDGTDIVCEVSWPDGSIGRVSDLEVELLDKF